MKVSAVNEFALPLEEARINASVIMCSGFFAQVVMLIKLTGLLSFPFSMIPLPVLLCTVSAGFFAGQMKMVIQKTPLKRTCLGFIITATGLLLLITVNNRFDGLALLPGLALSGIGQGIVLSAVLRKGEQTKPVWYSRGVMIGALITATALTMTSCLLLQSGFTSHEGYPYAFALLMDLSLFGAIYVRMIERENA